MTDTVLDTVETTAPVAPKAKPVDPLAGVKKFLGQVQMKNICVKASFNGEPVGLDLEFRVPPKLAGILIALMGWEKLLPQKWTEGPEHLYRAWRPAREDTKAETDFADNPFAVPARGAMAAERRSRYNSGRRRNRRNDF